MIQTIKEALGFTEKTKPCGCPWPAKGGYRSVRPPRASQTGEHTETEWVEEGAATVKRVYPVREYRCRECGAEFEIPLDAVTFRREVFWDDAD